MDKSEDAEGLKTLWGNMKKQKQEQEKEIKEAKEKIKQSPDAPILDKDDDVEWADEELDQILVNFPQFTSKAAAARRGEKEKETQKKAGAKNELHYLERSATKGWELLLEQWKVGGPVFLEKWRELLDEERKAHLDESRKFLLVMGGGSYASAVLYCPELKVDELASNKGTPFLVLLKKCLADPKTTPDDFVNKFLSGFGEVDKDKSMAEIITVSRRFILLSFVSRIICKVLDIPFTELAPVTALVQPTGDGTTATDEKKTKEVPLFEVQPDLRMCSYPPCEQFETKERSFPVCAYCKKVGRTVPYCSRECQGKDWTEHKKICGGSTATKTNEEEQKKNENEKGKEKENDKEKEVQPEPKEEEKVEETALQVEGGGMAGID